ncbi:hypothetical protein [Thioalkalivibrio sp. ALE31]|uniref:hypothetical protein n=1 Tax=Thioalkalivibrio sp. ALE31 TaxID=1158182 RepID=UPI0012DE0822|nr:hypothetical protein [Thioalkalivibrio sp. ALE31]
MPDIVQIRFDGDLVVDNRVSMRTLGNTLFYTQNALERAYLDIQRPGGVWKHARLKTTEREAVQFLIELPEPGSYLQRFISASELGRVIIDRASAALQTALDQATRQAEQEHRSWRDEVLSRRQQITQGTVTPRDYTDLRDNPDPRTVRAYGDKSIAKEFDNALRPIRSPSSGESQLDLTLSGTQTRTIPFDRNTSELLHQAISTRQVGDPVIYEGQLHQLDHRNKKGKFDNTANNKTTSLLFSSDDDVDKVRNLLGQNPFAFIGCPVIEFGSFDPNAGDVLFIDLVGQ